ncbi:10329_t:CDS:2 [Entrophospora sp. SA101]|nr:2544_t:CDS:2 [Entrophospora sp. SA101]CAJ0871911.1 10329_t:CDS:2 [Entrophospora sp. SA101]CAJ0924070.1 12740_t:CDS:2 [Entrophospora sp. SA101]
MIHRINNDTRGYGDYSDVGRYGSQMIMQCLLLTNAIDIKSEYGWIKAADLVWENEMLSVTQFDITT